MLRIEAGRLRGRKLLALPRGVPGLRPTAGRVRGAIFDRLGPEVTGAHVLDLFAGSGALSIEALSRGAARATLVEADPRVARFLHRQLEALGLGDATTVHRDQAAAFLAASRPQPHDLVFLDPPFATPEVFGPLCEALVGAGREGTGAGWLAPGAVIVCERERVRGKSPPIAWPEALHLEASRIYGQAVVEFLRHDPPAARRSEP